MVSTKLYAIILILFAVSTAKAGWIEEKDGKTIIRDYQDLSIQVVFANQ